jgi:predicted nuclease of predicted toxin-antitoxin system
VRFLLDVCAASRSLTAFLRHNGHDVLSAADLAASLPDDSLLALALKEGRILVTQDKDFGELAFVHKSSHGPVVRLVDMTVDQQVAAIEELLRDHADELVGQTIVVISADRTRIRRS